MNSIIEMEISYSISVAFHLRQIKIIYNYILSINKKFLYNFYICFNL